MIPPTPSVTIYTAESCASCVRAKEYLQRRGVPFAEVDITDDAAARAALIERSHGRRTVPQIFVGDVHVGGYNDLLALDAEDQFQTLLVASRGE
jgi:glutaredoxin 3